MSNWQVVTGDCVDTLRRLPDACIDAVVTDPPYGLSKEPPALEMLRHWLSGEQYDHGGSGFMGKTWDSFVPGPEVWREVLRVLKPGGHAVVFSGTRTYDLTVLAMRIAGFEIRDQLAWMYGTGFPKGLDISKQIDKQAGHWRGANLERSPKGEPITPDAIRWRGWDVALKPAQEPICLARKPLAGTVAANVLEHGTGGLNVDGCRIGDAGRWPANVLLDETAAGMLDEQSGYQKTGTAVRHRGVSGGATSISRPKPEGTPDVPAREAGGGASRFFYCAKTSKAEREAGLEHMRQASAGELTGGRVEGSVGLDNPRAGAGRTSEGRANTHPTVKPIALMRWLVRLVTPPGGVVLDPYSGSGSTGCAAVAEGFTYLGCELLEEYAEISRARIAHATMAR